MMMMMMMMVMMMTKMMMIRRDGNWPFKHGRVEKVLKIQRYKLLPDHDHDVDDDDDYDDDNYADDVNADDDDIARCGWSLALWLLL